MRTLIVAGLAVSLAACGAVPWNKQNYAGITSVEFDWCFEEEDISVSIAQRLEGVTPEQVAGILNALPVSWSPCKVKVIDGKEQSAIDFKFAMPDGTILNFAAEDVAAFEGQRIRGEVEKVVADQLGQAAPEVVDRIMDAITGGISVAGDGAEGE